MSVNQNPKFALKGSSNVAIARTGAGGFNVLNVDDLETTVSGKVDVAGDTMTGLLVLSGDPSADLGAATKQYADEKVAKSTLTTKGDLFGYDTDVTRIAVGSDGQLLIPDIPAATGLKWGNLVFNDDTLIANDDEIVTV